MDAPRCRARTKTRARSGAGRVRRVRGAASDGERQWRGGRCQGSTNLEERGDVGDVALLELLRVVIVHPHRLRDLLHGPNCMEEESEGSESATWEAHEHCSWGVGARTHRRCPGGSGCARSATSSGTSPRWSAHRRWVPCSQTWELARAKGLRCEGIVPTIFFSKVVFEI